MMIRSHARQRALSTGRVRNEVSISGRISLARSLIKDRPGDFDHCFDVQDFAIIGNIGRRGTCGCFADR